MLDSSATALAIASLAKPKTLVLDFETFSECNLMDCGAWVYAEHPSTEVLCMSYRTEEMPRAKIWIPSRGEPFPQVVIDYIEKGYFVEAHNAGFERAIWRHILTPKMGIPWPKRWKDTMATCAMRGLPLSLDDVGDVLNLTVKKDKRGSYLISKLCKPQKPTKKSPETRCNDPALLEELYAYCMQDTDTEWELGQKIGELTPSEYRIWVLDQKINDRGVAADIAVVRAAIKIVGAVALRYEAELARITGGTVRTGNQTKAMKEWFADNGYALSDCQADTIERLLARKNLPTNVKRVAEIRQILAHASTAKLTKYVDCFAKDGRIHGLLQYHGASTGRWAGRLVQPQNFPRGDEILLSMFSEHGEADEKGMNVIINDIMLEDPDYLDIVYGDAMEIIASALRGMMIAAKGKRYYVADFSAIEARVTAWLYDEQWKLDAFVEVDKGHGYKGSDDMYCASAATIFGRPIKKKTDKELRQVGKMCELAFGYQGGVGAWRNFDKRKPGDKGYVEDDQVDEYKNGWRAGHPNIKAGWWGIEEAAIETVRTGKPHHFSKVSFEVVNDNAGKWLTCILPNGRRLWYYLPEVAKVSKFGGEPRWELTYEGKDNKRHGAWGRISTYGGMLTENVVQAISRDLMVEAMIRVENAGYAIILTVHDEIIAETDAGFGSMEEFDKLMCEVPRWAFGCPIHASGWTGFRYHKE